MNRITKKLCGILCASVAMLTIGGVKALGNAYISIPSSISPSDGKFTFPLEGVYGPLTVATGDVNQDGVVDLDDAQLTVQYYLGTYTAGINETDAEKAVFKQIADIDGDGDVDLTDAQKILRYSLKIETPDLSDTTIIKNYSDSEIKSVKYLIVNGDSELYDQFEEYFNLIEKTKSDDNAAITKANTKYTQLMTAINNSKLTTSSDKKTVSGNLGTTKVDDIYIYVVTELNDGNSGFYYKKYDTSDASYWTFLKSSASTNVSNKTTIDNGSSNESSSKTTTTTTTTTTEETVENPNTAVTVTVMGLVIAAVAGAIVAKKKNLFSRI